MGSRKHILDGGPNRHMRPCKGAICRGKDIPGHVPLYSSMGCAKMAEPIEMQFGLRTQVLDGIQIALVKGQFLPESTCMGMPEDTLP